MDSSQFSRLYRMIESTKKAAIAAVLLSSLSLATVVGLRIWDEVEEYQWRERMKQTRNPFSILGPGMPAPLNRAMTDR